MTAANSPWRLALNIPRSRSADGHIDRLESDGWIGGALAALPEDDDGILPAPTFDEVLGAMGVATVEDLRSFRRLVALHAALAAIRWATADPVRAGSAA